MNAIAPAAATRMTASMPEDKLREWAVKEGWATQAEADTLTPKELLERALGSPDDVAPLAVYLASDQAGNVNGEIFSVSGGRVGVYCHVIETRTIFKDGRWTAEELIAVIPRTLAADLVKPAVGQER